MASYHWFSIVNHACTEIHANSIHTNIETKTIQISNRFNAFVFTSLKWCALCAAFIKYSLTTKYTRTYRENFKCNQLNVNNKTKWTLHLNTISVLRIAYTKYKFIGSIFSIVGIYVHLCISNNSSIALNNLIARWTSFISSADQTWLKKWLPTSHCRCFHLCPALRRRRPLLPKMPDFESHKTNNSFMSISV